MKYKISVRRLAEKAMRETTGMKAKDAVKASARMAELIIEEIQNHTQVHIPEIGKLVVKKYGPRQGYDPVREVVVPRRPCSAVRFIAYTASKKHAELKGL